MKADRLALALEEARRIEKQLDEADRHKENEREEALTINLALLERVVVG